MPSRIVYTFNEDDGHIINEVLLDNEWVLVDSTNGFVYENESTYVSLKDLVFDKDYRQKVLERYDKYYYSKPSYFDNVYISYYWESEFEKYNYELSFCNEYYENALSGVWNAENNKKN